MANYARSLGMPQKYIYIEERSLNTIGNFYFIKKEILKPLKLRSLLIITKAEHLQKSRFLAKKILGPKYRLAWKTDGALRMKARSDHAQLSDIKQFFKDIRDGDDKKIAVLLGAHKYYRRYRKF